MWLWRKILPKQLRNYIRTRLVPLSRLAAHTHKVWIRPDPSAWPDPKFKTQPGIEQYQYRLFSQNGEDGIIRHLLETIGFRSRRFVEFGFHPEQCNSLRLMLREGFGGVFLDGSEHVTRHFNDAVRRFGITKVKAANAFLTTANINDIITANGITGEIDFLSIDVDGNDYWLWEAIHCVAPRILAIEYNASLGPELSLSVPYDPEFVRTFKHPSGLYCGASLTALTRLSQRKGYRLVGCESRGVNAFFIREDCLTDGIRTITPAEAYRPHRRRLNRGLSQETQFNTIKDLPYTVIE